MTFALLPVKEPARAKNRLGGLLAPDERGRLARLLFEHVLGVLTTAPGLDRVVIASSDTWVLETAARAGAETIAEESQNGHSDSADRAALACMARGAGKLLMVPIDVPLMSPADIESVLAAAASLKSPSLVIVPSADGTGTNALLRTPPDIIESRFGPGSFEQHVGQARARGAAVEVVRPGGLVFDLDTPEDVTALLAGNGAGAVVDYLRSLELPRRKPK